jgi:hypothetical protein
VPPPVAAPELLASFELAAGCPAPLVVAPLAVAPAFELTAVGLGAATGGAASGCAGPVVVGPLGAVAPLCPVPSLPVEPAPLWEASSDVLTPAAAEPAGAGADACTIEGRFAHPTRTTVEMRRGKKARDQRRTFMRPPLG